MLRGKQEKKPEEQKNTNRKQFQNGKRETSHDRPMATKTRTKNAKSSREKQQLSPHVSPPHGFSGQVHTTLWVPRFFIMAGCVLIPR